MKSSAKKCLDIRNFFQVQDEDEDSDDTIDEMEMNSSIPRMEMLPEVPNQYSQEDALEKLLPLVKITRNKKIEAKNDKMMWEQTFFTYIKMFVFLLDNSDRLNEQKIQFEFEKCTAHTTIKANQDAVWAQI